jgi:hypothetical protein
MDINAVLAHFGTRYKIAKALGLRPHTPYQWKPHHVPERYHARLAEIMRQTQPEAAGATNDGSQG